jgi:hypothetical protein
MENELVRDVFWALQRAIGSDLSPEAEFRQHQAACEISNQNHRPTAAECLYDSEIAQVMGTHIEVAFSKAPL